MKTAEYASVIILLFVKNIDKEYCNSVKEVIQLTDVLAKKFKLRPKIVPYSTKYHLIHGLVSSKILTAKKDGSFKKIKLAEPIKNYLMSEE